ncbi:ABC transporter substrate-binding protein [Planctomonas psychrotolerans]|uniref:ABC transporter substrate-binding protein n=1 Tax=Planctomonas psychrotolerans TaxID=2528712 RepID=UPI001D0D7196|nr:ABC transporter substrate-binding protein [Planctomonas psychrotolerans]
MSGPRTVLAAAVVLTTTIGVSGCSSEPADDRTQLTVLSWSGEDVMTPIVESFEEANPDINVQLTTAPPVAEYISTLQNRLGSNTAPDVFVMAAENKTNLIEGGFVMDLSDEPFMDVASEFNTATYTGPDGAEYGLSLSSWASGIMYNKGILEEHGITEFPQDWDSFTEALQTLKDAGEVPFLESWQGFPTSLGSSVGLANYEQGGNVDAAIFEGDATFTELWTEPLTPWQELFQDGLITTDVVGLTGDQVVDEFVNERVAMITAGPWNITAVREGAPDLEFDFAGVPQAGGDPFYTGAASPGWAIYSEAKEPEAAKAFLSFLASEEGVQQFQELTNDMTTTSNFTPEIDEALTQPYQALLDGKFYLPMISWPRYQDALYTELVAQIQLMAQGQATPEAVGTALDARLTQEEGK